MNLTKIFTADTVLEGKQIKRPLISDDLYFYIMFISMGVICQIISLFGTISNIINIITFVKQGFSDYINICLLALAVSDLCSLLFLMWTNLCFTPAFVNLGLPFVTYEVQLISGSWPHATFTRTTGWLTSFISFERCVCVSLPLKVKSIFTPRVHALAVTTIYIITVGSCFSLGYISIGLGWKYYSETNKTLVGLVPYGDANLRHVAVLTSYAVNGVFMPISAFVFVVVCTIVLIIKLKQQTKWRQLSTSASPKNMNGVRLASRDKKVAKMVVLISTIFILSFIPAVGIFIAGYVDREFSFDGLNKNAFLIAFSASFTAEAINSSINILIYFSMSTKFRETFYSLFLPKK